MNTAAKWLVTVQMNIVHRQNSGKIQNKRVTNLELNEHERTVSRLPSNTDQRHTSEYLMAVKSTSIAEWEDSTGSHRSAGYTPIGSVN